MKPSDKTRYVCLGCKGSLTVKEVREDTKGENLCAKCRAKQSRKGRR